MVFEFSQEKKKSLVYRFIEAWKTKLFSSEPPSLWHHPGSFIRPLKASFRTTEDNNSPFDKLSRAQYIPISTTEKKQF